jgi:ribosomal protein S18 acetylase RimI-like enzyme
LKVEGKLVAVMRIIEPGACKTSRTQLFRLTPRLIKTIGLRFLRVLKWLSFLGEHDPDERHWNLGWFAVDPKLQGKGIGTMLLTYFCGLMDQQGDGAYVVTAETRNVKLYERYAFSVEYKDPFFGVTHSFMKRPPPGLIV